MTEGREREVSRTGVSSQEGELSRRTSDALGILEKRALRAADRSEDPRVGLSVHAKTTDGQGGRQVRTDESKISNPSSDTIDPRQCSQLTRHSSCAQGERMDCVLLTEEGDGLVL